jgi:deoxyribodipyrimidine photo-lyase
MSTVPDIRRSACNDAPIRQQGSYVVYWMTAYRRLSYNYALQQAVDLAQTHQVPLVILEALRSDYKWASDRHHQFIIDGMADQARRLADTNVTYYPYVEPDRSSGSGKGLLEALGEQAVAVVTDDFPAFMLPRMTAAAADKLDVRLEKVDSNGIVPLYAPSKMYKRAYDFRRWFQRNGREHLDCTPRQHPLVGKNLSALDALPDSITKRWPTTPLETLADPEFVSRLPIDHEVSVVDSARGGEQAGRERLEVFLDERLDGYADHRNKVQGDHTSQLSFHLHFGHISAHEIVAAVLDREDWSFDDLGDDARGKREGWWGLSPHAEAFLEEVITWREVGFNTCVHLDNYHRYESLPDWAIETLEEHADDPRQHLYSLEDFERAETHDELWNAAQLQLVREGRIHNYLRMLWGKKILHWSASPREALEYMIELNNKYALDGRVPNSYNGIFWVLGRFDRPWGPEREIFGKVRYMTSKSTRRKYKVDRYINRWLRGVTPLL